MVNPLNCSKKSCGLWQSSSDLNRDDAIITVPSTCPPATHLIGTPRSIPIITGGRPMYPISTSPFSNARTIASPPPKRLQFAFMSAFSNQSVPIRMNKVWYTWSKDDQRLENLPFRTNPFYFRIRDFCDYLERLKKPQRAQSKVAILCAPLWLIYFIYMRIIKN